MRAPSPAALLVASVVAVQACAPAEEAEPASQNDATVALIARAKTFELPTEYVPPPGEAIDHHTSGFAKILCSAVFITGLDPADAAENVGYFTSPYAERAVVTDTVVDYDRQEVRLTLPSGVVRVAKKYGSQGCVTRPIGEDSVFFTPTTVTPNLPPAATTPWPMGDVLSEEPYPAELDMAKVAEAVDAAFGPPEAMTEAFLVTYRGRVIGERYGEGIDLHTPLESWSMGKSLTGTLMGILIQRGVYELWQPAPVPEWYETAGDPRQQIRIGDIMRMSSGIRIRAPQDPDFDPSLGYPDHLYLYTGIGRLLPLRRDAPAAVAAQHGRAVSEHRPRPHELPHPPGRRGEAARGLPRLPAARALRQDRRARRRHGDRPLRRLPHAGLRVPAGARLGAGGEPLVAGRRVERRAPASRGLRGVCAHAGAGLGGRREADLRGRLPVGQRHAARSRSRRRRPTSRARAARTRS